MSAVIGALRVTLGIDTAAFEKGLSQAQKSLAGIGRSFESVGKALSASVTAPLAAFGALTLKTAGGFEAAMNRVEAAAQAPADTVAHLGLLARDLGKLGPGATQAAEGIEGLIKNGLSATQVLEGAGKATVLLAQAGEAQLGPAADVVTDIMAQFSKQASEMGTVVDRVSGTMVASKLDFDNYRLAIGQAGGVAGKLGVSLDDFNAVLAATSPAFSSGSDAGTSFKTFLTRLVPSSDKAAAKMKDLGLQFFTAAGAMKTMPEIADTLRNALSGLSDEARNDALTTVFGTDALRTALLLSEQGAAGINKVKDAIAGISATDQAAAKLKGFNGAMRSLGAAFEDLQIAIGQSGLLEFATDLVQGLTSLINELGASSPELLRWGTIMAAVAAGIGPVILVAGLLATAIAAIGIPAAAVIAGVVALGAAFATFRGQIMTAVGGVWDAINATLGPRLQGLFTTLQPILTAFGNLFASVVGSTMPQSVGALTPVIDALAAAFRGAFGEALTAVLTAAVQFLTAALQNFANLINAIAALVRGDFAEAWRLMGEIARTAGQAVIDIVTTMTSGILSSVGTLATGVGQAFIAMKDQAVLAAQQLYEGVKTWLVDKMTSVFNAAAALPGKVTAKLYEMYDKAVGHSYVPDMVNEIGAWFGKLGGMMVPPTEAATAKVGESFKAAANSTKASFAGIGQAFGQVGGAFKGATRGFFDDLKNGVKLTDALKNAAMDLLDKLSNMALDGVLNGLFGGGAGGAKGGGGGLLGSILGSLFGGLPGFANGGSGTVGGAGGIDSQVVAFRATPGEMVDIRKPGQTRPDGAGRLAVDVTPSKYFDVHVTQIAEPISQRHAAQTLGASNKLAPGRMQRFDKLGS